jgi:hypothetical protein
MDREHDASMPDVAGERFARYHPRVTIERLGQASFPSGRVIVADTGTLSSDDADEWENQGVVVDDLPRGTFAVHGERVGEGAPWRELWVELAAGAPAVEEFAGTVSIESGRLSFIDHDAIGAWRELAKDEGKPVAELIARARDSSTGSGELELANGRTCLCLTGEGDGVFPVYVDRDHTGQVVRVRVRLQKTLD